MQAEEIPSVISYQSLLEVLGQKTLVGYSPEERVEVAHLMQCLKHLQSETEYRVLLSTQMRAGHEPENELVALRNWWSRVETRCAALFQRARLIFFA